MARAPRRWQAVLFMLVVLPFWTSFLIRIYAWINILQRDGLLNQVLLALGIVDAPPVWLATDTAIYIGIVYSYLPFMVLPIYATLEKMDETLLEAAADLGCPRWKAFWLVTLPLVAAGRDRRRAALLHSDRRRVRHSRSARRLATRLMIGQTLWTEFFGNKDWPVASAVAVVLLLPAGRADRDLPAACRRAIWSGGADHAPAACPGSTSPRSRSGWRSSICRS